MKGTPETPQCGFSRTSIQILGLQGVDPTKFTAFNVLEDEELRSGIKEYSDWPTIPQLYVDKEFVGGCDILINMHKDGSLADLLAQKQVIIEEDSNPETDTDGQQAQETRATTEQSTGGRSKDAKDESSEPAPEYEGQKAQEARATTEQSTGGRSKDAKGESS
ncbi:monothiol glutaredoxin grx5 [Elasticomyces elasticus]|uniref:Monothiol glutaredoxin grx5 n=1 Tax=Exophiala sideris TaxID=1016849 RepID=A0ABR0JEI7_9EURO|nr:monothiol glutaredoxin grx5 [Elasticomyces elasticus]KAK5032085.1 monothiol glutaredoxin grx5 [Exophiala sideris]KAK5041012.1 monothiol glutaredoxin grx5 [Exophiala sideris]KAK5061654.1 monothiol glutaredoxin grx5 [Exophiala sideris]KAK5184353.1 monothiol glutaredoxin grx5 [Eurotiomycetes sp. CCFEE 6388]